MKNSLVETLLDRYPIISDQVSRPELSVLLRELTHSLQVYKKGGNVVELGCYVGTTSLFLRRLMDAAGATGELHVYDSFEGLPGKTVRDASGAGEQFRAGELAASKKGLLMNFNKAGVRAPIVHKGWFHNLTEADLPDSIAFAFLDGDFYESIADSLRLVEKKLLPHATLVVDDYVNEALPGAARAVDEWCERRAQWRVRAEHSLAIITR